MVLKLQLDRVCNCKLVSPGQRGCGGTDRRAVTFVDDGALVKYTKEILEEAVRSSKSYADVMRQMGVKCTGGNHGHLKAKIASYGIDITHFLGRRTNCGGAHRGGPERKSHKEILSLGQPGSLACKAFQLRRALIEIGRKYACAACGLEASWN